MFDIPSLRIAASLVRRRISVMLFGAAILYSLGKTFTIHRGLEAFRHQPDVYGRYDQHQHEPRQRQQQQLPSHHYVVTQRSDRQLDLETDVISGTNGTSSIRKDRVVEKNSVKKEIEHDVGTVIIKNYNSKPLLPQSSNRNIDQKQPLSVRIVTFQGAPPMMNFLFRRPLANDSNTNEANYTGGPSNITMPWYTRLSDEMLNICLDGMTKSPFFQVLEPIVVPYTKFDAKSATHGPSNNRKRNTKGGEPFVIKETEPVVWMIDVRSLQLFPDIDYVNDPVLQLVYNTRKWQQRQEDLRNDGHRHPIHIVFMDWRDRMGTSLCKSATEWSIRDEAGRKLKAIEQIRFLLGPQSIVRHVQQQLVYKRRWNESTSFVDFGRVMDDYIDYYDKCYNSSIRSVKKNDDELVHPTISTSSSSIDGNLEYFASNIHYHIPYTVRSDFVESVRRYTMTKTPPLSYVTTTSNHMTNQQKQFRLLPPELLRHIDVVHLFNATSTENHSKLRKAVSTALLELAHTDKTTTNHYRPDDHRRSAGVNNNITVIASAVSESGANGRVNVQEKYLSILMSSKIVVVAQRDKWEDHYVSFVRFFFCLHVSSFH